MKNLKYFWLVVILSFLPLAAIIFNPLLVHTHDGPVHLARMGAWFKAFMDGQLPVRWAADLNYGYGSPVLIFMYPWPYFLATVLVGLGLGLAAAFKSVLVLSFLVSAVFMFLFAQEFFKDKKVALLTTLLYQFASFRLVEISVRGSLGEVWVYAFAPLVLWGLAKIFNGQVGLGWWLAALGTGLLIISHNSISLAFFGAAVLFMVFFAPRLRLGLAGFSALLFGLMLSAFYWLPALWERKYTYGDLFMKDLYLEHFPELGQLFWPNPLNLVSGQVHDITVQFGAVHVLAVLIALYLWFKKRLTVQERRTVAYSLVIIAGCVFLMQPVSVPLWQNLALLRQFQFSWRLLSLVTLATAMLGFVLLRVNLSKRLYWPLCAFIILLTISWWRPMLGFDRINESEFWNYPLSTTYFGEANTIWAANPPQSFPENRVEIIGGKGEISNFIWTTTSQKFLVKNQTEVNILSNTLFFPGWRVFSDGQEVPIEFQNQNHRGLITFRLPAGEHQVEIKFGQTRDRQVGEIISLISISILLGLSFVGRLRQSRKKGSSF
ncbi:hypothetical protein COT65_02145 [Candidatus Shapirobacteria bacterium CG09_land_8_20_14_0_10_47_13]|uniref:Membrane protein 6-pyruvoyl-tetrahydropterin synthase-related domain-containing protein n=1 Tax=Candidatus Shapirobacteria bacterium CG09_land_8_20_14_0_10_47_13 TaxID=1974481 RepID=A0A2H0WME2_9BACT|nr:MAG: hypothetical protein COT65_02145 [Candidatus Shapirobacteria bacterium CG09_land_8_20_14_0_10_47_13]